MKYLVVGPTIINDIIFADQSRKDQVLGGSIFCVAGIKLWCDDCLYLSAIPWLCFTGLTHAENLDRDDAIPRISWGSWFWLGDRLLLPFSVQAHHALVDGVHLGQFIDALQKKLDAF